MCKETGNWDPGLSPADRIDALCDRFEMEWSPSQPPSLEQFLKQLEKEDQEAGFWELLGLEIELRRCAGEIPQPTEYEVRFPDYHALINKAFADQETFFNPTDVLETQSSVPVSSNTFDFTGTDRFEVRGKLGEGGFGKVYRVYDRAFHEECALKILSVSEASSLYRFKKEFRVLAGLSHPNLTQFRELIADENQWFFTMELVEGSGLVEYLRSRFCGSFNDQFLLTMQQIFAQVIDGLDTLHQAGYVHRDIKPANVLVTPKGQVVILDLGLVSAIEGATPEWQLSTEQGVAGTIAYMSPEQLEEESGPASDFYAVGVMLFETLTGKLPFVGSALKIIKDKQYKSAPPPQQLDASIPQEWNDLCQDLLKKNPADRPSVDQIRNRLHLHQQAVPTRAQRASDSKTILIGRDDELTQLRDAYASLSDGRPKCVYVHGLSGIGKTSLTDRFLQEVHEKSTKAVVLGSRCYERESVPYKALDGVVDALSRYLNKLPADQVPILLPRHTAELARLFPVLQRTSAVEAEVKRLAPASDQQESRRRAVEALGQILATLADRCTLILMLDDLQWGDADSARILRTILEGNDPPALLLLGTYRSDELGRSPCLQILLEESQASPSDKVGIFKIGLQELPRSAAEVLAAQLLAETSLDSQEAERIAQESKGSPFFIKELVTFLKSGASGKTTLEAAIISRVGRLEKSSRILLEFIASCAHPVTRSEALTAAQTSHASLERLSVEHFIRTSGPANDALVEPYHDRIRETVAASLCAEQRANIHHRLAEVLQESHRVDAQTLAKHYELAGAFAEAGLHYAKAAQLASDQYAFNQAAQLWLKSLELIEAPDAQQLQKLHSQIAAAFANDGQGHEAARHYLIAAESTNNSEQRFEWNRLAMMRLFQAGALTEAFGLLEKLLTDVNLNYPGSTTAMLRGILWERMRESAAVKPLAKVLWGDSSELLASKRVKTCWAAAQSLSILDPMRGYYFQQIGEREAEQLDHLPESWQLRAYGACLISASGKPKEMAKARNQLQSIRTASSFPDSVFLQTFVQMCEGVVDYLTSKFPSAISRCTEAMESYAANCPEAWWETDLSRTFATFSANFSGDIQTIRRLNAIEGSTSSRDTTYFDLMVRGVSEIVLNMAEDDFSSAHLRTSELSGLLDFEQFNNLHFNYYLRHLWELRYASDHEQCYQLLTSIEPGFRSSLLHLHHWARHAYHMHRATSAVALMAERRKNGRSDELFKRLQHDARHQIQKLRKEQRPACIAIAELLTAGLESIDNPADAENALKKALQIYETEGLTMHAAICHDRLLLLNKSVASSESKEIRDRYVVENEIVDARKFFAVFSPGCWPC